MNEFRFFCPHCGIHLKFPEKSLVIYHPENEVVILVTNLRFCPSCGSYKIRKEPDTNKEPIQDWHLDSKAYVMDEDHTF